MKALLTAIGSRGEVQPLLALALELRALGHEARICAAPNFRPWVESLGVAFAPLGPDLEEWTRSRRTLTQDPAQAPQPPTPPTREQMRQLAVQSVADQFRVLGEVARDCDLILAGGMILVAGRSIAEALDIPYIHMEYCPATLPSFDHPPATTGATYLQGLPAAENQAIWAQEEDKVNSTFLEALNEHRAALGLSPVDSVLRHVATRQPWLAADPILAPAARHIGMEIHQTGAWFLADPTPLPELLETFLAAGPAPIYFGFGSMRVAPGAGQACVEAARALGYRALLSEGWGQLDASAEGTDYLTIGGVNHARLFPLVAAVVHHGGAGTTTAVARAGKPQLLVPHMFDQHYWAHRVRALGIGTAGLTPATLTGPALAEALAACVQPDKTARAQDLAGRMELHGAHKAAARLVAVAAEKGDLMEISR